MAAKKKTSKKTSKKASSAKGGSTKKASKKKSSKKKSSKRKPPPPMSGDQQIARTRVRSGYCVHGRKVPKEMWAVFIRALMVTGRVNKACDAIGVGYHTAYNHRKSDPEFRKEWDEALQANQSLLEDEAIRRAVEGVKKPIYQGGKLVGHRTDYSDTLLIFMLKGLDPKKYRDRHEVHTTGDGKRDIADLMILANTEGRFDDAEE